MTRLYRRSFIALVIGTVFIRDGFFATVTGNALAQPTARRRTCLTDTDSGPGADQPNYGTRTGLTDIDPTDGTGRGTLSRLTDTDASDSANRGVGARCENPANRCTDNDNGATADVAGRGRHCGRGGQGQTGVTDHDTTDAAGRGRGAGLTDNDATDRAGNGRGGRSPPPPPSSALQSFPWCPPPPSSWYSLDRMLFPGDGNLFAVNARLEGALTATRAGYAHMISYYNVPNGYALVARLELLRGDGSADPRNRFSPDILNEDRSPLVAQISEIIRTNVPGGDFYRQIVFIVTDQNWRNCPIGSAPGFSREGIRVEPGRAKELPREPFSQMAFTAGHRVTALIYEYRKTLTGGFELRMGNAVVIPQAKTHLQRAGILQGQALAR